MNWYFHQERGKVMGPFTTNDMRERIREGQVKAFDLIYREGEPGWRMALEQPELRDCFKGGSVADLKDRPWVCLHRKSSESFDFVTLGPFSLEDIRVALQEGLLSYRDYAWKNGFNEWKRIGGLPEFNRRRESRSAVSPIESTEKPLDYELASKKDILNNVVQMRRPTLPLEPEPPPEAKGEDLARITVSFNDELTPAEPPRPPLSPNALSTDSETAELQPVALPDVDSKAPSRRWVDLGIVAVLAFILVGVLSYVMVKRLRSTAYVSVQPPGNIVTNDSGATGNVELTLPFAPSGSIDLPSPPAAKEDANGEPSAKSEKSTDAAAKAGLKPLDDEFEPGAVKKALTLKVKKEPTELAVAIQGRGASQPKIDIRSNGTSDIPVYVQIVGLPGTIGENGSFYRYMKLSSTGSLSKSLDLSKINLPKGRFTLHVETGSLEKKTTFSYGTGDAHYKQAVVKARKAQAADIWSERLALYRLTEKMESALSQAQMSHHLAGGFERLSLVSKANGGNYLLFNDWWEMKQIWQEGRRGFVKGEGADSLEEFYQDLIDRTRKLHERMASFSVTKVK